MRATRPPYACVQMPDTVNSMFDVPKDAKIRFLPDQPEMNFFLTPNGIGMAIDIEADSFLKSTIPFSSKRLPIEYDERSVALINALRKKRAHVKVDAPVRKKKSWLRYTSTKKWARKFKSQRVVQSAERVVLQVPSSLYKKIKQLSKPLSKPLSP